MVHMEDIGEDTGGDTGVLVDIDVYQYEEGNLILDFIDPKSKELIWRGSAKAVVGNEKTPEERQKKIEETIQKILEKYPPHPKQ